MSTDRIEKQVLLRAPLSRVWNAIADSRQFGAWFGVAIDGPFVAGARVDGAIVPTTVDAEVARHQEPYRGMRCEFHVEQVEAMRRFSFRWHPGGDPRTDEPTTLVVFELEEVDGGTQLTITESGFDRIPLARRAKAFADNQNGWEMQLQLIAKYLLAHPDA